jgi:hypothetical protein
MAQWTKRIAWLVATAVVTAVGCAAGSTGGGDQQGAGGAGASGTTGAGKSTSKTTTTASTTATTTSATTAVSATATTGACMSTTTTAGAGGGCTGGAGGGATIPPPTGYASWPMPNPPSTGLPNPASYDTGTPGVVLDDVTGLVWQEPPDPAQTMVTWSAAQTYCQGLSVAGQGSFRLPSILELLSILDYTVDSGLPPAFSAPAASWSSTPYLGVGGDAWTVVFGNGGFALFKPTTSTFAARCVSAGNTAAGGYSTANGTVLDTATGLTWESGFGGPDTWDDAVTYCSCNTPALPCGGWRLPSIKELATLVDFDQISPAIDPAAFPGTPVDFFWSSSRFAPAGGTSAWYLDFTGGNVAYGMASGVGTGDAYRVRCVR